MSFRSNSATAFLDLKEGTVYLAVSLHSRPSVVTMKTILLSTCVVLGLVPTCLAQTAQTPLDMSTEVIYQRARERAIPVIDEDSARIVISSEKTHYLDGDTVQVDIDLKNVGTKPFGSDADRGSVHEFFDIEATDAGGNKVPFGRARNWYKMTSGISGWLVKPGGRISGCMYLNYLFDLPGGPVKVVVSKKFRRGKDIVTVSSQPLTLEVDRSFGPVDGWTHIIP